MGASRRGAASRQQASPPPSRRRSWEQEQSLSPERDHDKRHAADDRAEQSDDGRERHQPRRQRPAPSSNRDDDVPKKFTAEDERLLKKITIVAQLDKVPEPPPQMRKAHDRNGTGEAASSSRRGGRNDGERRGERITESLSSRFGGANLGR